MRCVLPFVDSDGLAFQADAGGWTTIGQLCAPDYLSLRIVEFAALFEGIDSTDHPVLVQLVRQSTAGTGGDVMTPVHENQSETAGEPFAKAILTTGLVDIDTAEPTTGAILRSYHVHPQSGLVYPYRPGRVVEENLSVSPGERIGVRVYPQDNVDVTGYIVFTEGGHI